MSWSMSIERKYSEIPEKLVEAARRYCARHGCIAGKSGSPTLVQLAEEHADDSSLPDVPVFQMSPVDLELRGRAIAWRRAKARALALPVASTDLYWPRGDARHVLYAGRMD